MTDVVEEVEKRSVDEMLEEAEAKLPISEEALKTEIKQYFYDSGYWERPELPPVVEHVDPLMPKVEEEEETEGFTLPDGE